MSLADSYYGQVQLLLDLLPLVAERPCFALKGGTAINLFVRDMPRLSVDIDLVYLPACGRAEAIESIKEALLAISARIQDVFPQAKVTESFKQKVDALRLVVQRDLIQVQIELSPVLRGTISEPAIMPVSARVEEEFGYAEMKVVSLPDLYGGKICAALDRQHPRDWFDVKLLLDSGDYDRSIFLGFLVYLLGHPRPLNEVLFPRWKSMRVPYENEFLGMLREAVSLADLEQTRTRLMRALAEKLTEQDVAFLLSFKSGEPDWTLLPLDGIAGLPAVRWKLHNISKMPAARHKESLNKLEAVLAQLKAGKLPDTQ